MLFRSELTNKETVAIHDNFYLRFTGKNKGDLVLSNNEDYGGLLALGRKLSETHKGFWHVVPLNANFREPGEGSSVDKVLNGNNPYNKNRLIRDGVALRDVNEQEVDQAPCFRPKGFCVPGSDAQGRWFINLEDSLDRMGAIYGTMHPNIYGQLYYVSKVYPRLPFASSDSARPRLSSLWQPHENIINEQGLHEDEQGLSCIYR